MVQAARQLIRERGYNATAFPDVLELSGAPRGSVYFHFPGGKTQLAMEAAEAHAHEQVTIIDRAAARADSAAQLVELYVDLGREGMVDSNYERGCAVAPLVTESAAQESADVSETTRRAFSRSGDSAPVPETCRRPDRAIGAMVISWCPAGWCAIPTWRCGSPRCCCCWSSVAAGRQEGWGMTRVRATVGTLAVQACDHPQAP
ncbi:MAG: helix-turn-helix domain-containing protein [Streptosporangiaceae bacterium]